MEKALQEEVRRRAGRLCEYCRMPEPLDSLPFEIDHIVALKHGGQTTSDNLALACFACNHHKGPNIAGFDPATGEIVRLFHPRHDDWPAHFQWNGPLLVGLTPVGRTTITVLEINLPYRVALRLALLEEEILR